MSDPTYEVAVQRSFRAKHFLRVPDAGDEGSPHQHQYTLEIRLASLTLNEHGYVVDIDAVKRRLDAIEDRYAGTLLNDLPAFADDNPSLERFAKQIVEDLVRTLSTDDLQTLTVRLWEDEVSWAQYTHHVEE